MNGKFVVICVQGTCCKIVKTFIGHKGFIHADKLRDKLNKKQIDATCYYYVKGELCLGL